MQYELTHCRFACEYKAEFGVRWDTTAVFIAKVLSTNMTDSFWITEKELKRWNTYCRIENFQMKFQRNHRDEFKFYRYENEYMFIHIHLYIEDNIRSLYIDLKKVFVYFDEMEGSLEEKMKKKVKLTKIEKN